eukprot:2900-Heterococcus_DN1.PRE.1
MIRIVTAQCLSATLQVDSQPLYTKLITTVVSYYLHCITLQVLLAAAQCLLVRARLLADPNPYNQLNFRYLPPLDSEILVSAAFCLIPHVPQSLLDEIARHPLADPNLNKTAAQQKNSSVGSAVSASVSSASVTPPRPKATG